jgi:glycosyltransferase involved in cell wall biosynthesis
MHAHPLDCSLLSRLVEHLRLETRPCSHWKVLKVVSRLAVVTSHPIQYYGPLFRELAKEVDLHVFFAHRATPVEQARAGFGTAFEWDVDITFGYAHSFLVNIAGRPGTDHFFGCDTPELERHLRGGQFDGLLVMGWHLKSYLQGLFAAKRMGLPVMVRGDSQLATPRSSFKAAIKSLTFSNFLRLFDAALYVGQRSKAYYENYGYPADRLFFSPHCVDTEWFATQATAKRRARLRGNLKIAPEARVLLFAGKLVAFKRPLDLAAAAAATRARGTNVEVMVAGDGELRSELAAAAEAAGVPLHLLGFYNQTEMPSAYAAADCLVLPSDGRETWGLVANEALACGRPIIVSDACGCGPDLAVDPAVGRRFPVGEVDVLSRAIAEITEGPPAAVAIATVSRKYSLREAASGIATALAAMQRA